MSSNQSNWETTFWCNFRTCGTKRQLPIIVNVSFHVNSYLIADPKLEIGSYNTHLFTLCVFLFAWNTKYICLLAWLGINANLLGYNFCYLKIRMCTSCHKNTINCSLYSALLEIWLSRAYYIYTSNSYFKCSSFNDQLLYAMVNGKSLVWLLVLYMKLFLSSHTSLNNIFF